MPCTTGYNFHKHLWEIFRRKLHLLQLFDKFDFLLLIRKFLQKMDKEKGALFFREINFRKIFVKLISRKKMSEESTLIHTHKWF